jgi:hypothetical protein
MTPAASHLRVGTHVGLRRRVMQVADNDRHGSFWQHEVVLEVCSEAPDPSRGEQGCKMTNLQLETQHMRKIGPGCPVTHEHIPWTPRLHDTHTLPAPSLPGWIAMAASQAASFHLGQQSMHRPKSLLTSSDLTPGGSIFSKRKSMSFRTTRPSQFPTSFPPALRQEFCGFNLRAGKSLMCMADLGSCILLCPSAPPPSGLQLGSLRGDGSPGAPGERSPPT